MVGQNNEPQPQVIIEYPYFSCYVIWTWMLLVTQLYLKSWCMICLGSSIWSWSSAPLPPACTSLNPLQCSDWTGDPGSDDPPATAGTSPTSQAWRRSAPPWYRQLPGRSSSQPRTGLQTRGQAAVGGTGVWQHHRGPSCSTSQQSCSSGNIFSLLVVVNEFIHEFIHFWT